MIISSTDHGVSAATSQADMQDHEGTCVLTSGLATRSLWMPGTWPGAGYRLGSDRGSPNDGNTLLSKRVMAQIRSPARVST